MAKDILIGNLGEIFYKKGQDKGIIEGEIKVFEKLFNEGVISEEKYKIEVEPLRRKLEELTEGNN